MSIRRRSTCWFFAALVVYAVTSASGPIWADSSKLTLYALHGLLPSLNPGDHPGWTAIADVWLALTSWLGAVRALHLLSALSAALTVALAARFATIRSGSAQVGDSVATVLLVAHSLWWSATVTETYAPAALLVVATALGVRNDARGVRATATGIAAGLAAAVHAFTIPLTVPFLVALPKRRWPLAGLGVALGSSPIWLALWGTPVDPLTGHHAATAASWRWVLATFLHPAAVVHGAIALASLFAFGVGPIALVAMVRARREGLKALHPSPRLGAVLALGLTAVLLVYAPYRLHVMVLFPVLAAILIVPPRLAPRERLAHIVLQLVLYTAVPAALVATGHGGLGGRELPGRINAWYFLNPVKAFDHGAGQYARELLEAAPADAVILADFNPGAPLRLVQETAGLREDVRIVPTAVDETLAAPDPARALAARITAAMASRRPVVLADRWPPYYHPDRLRELGFRLTPCGPGWRVEPES